MTVRMPGEECLTKTQEAQRAFRKKFVEKSQDPLAPTGAQTSNKILPNATEPSNRSDASLTVNKAPSRGITLNLNI